MVPFLNLHAQHALLRDEIAAAIAGVIESSTFAGGPAVTAFEDQFAAYCRTRYAAGVGSGTEALWFSLLALGVGPGDEVITVPSTFIATAEAISYCGATPVFVDVDERTYTMDPAALEEAITPRTKAVIPVHLYGQMADMAAISAVAARFGLYVVEDACQAHGAEFRGRRAGSMGHVGCFSFYPGKNLGALGEAGAVVSNDATVIEKIRQLRDHGQSAKYHHAVVGWNGRMDGIQAAVLSLKLQHLDRGNALRQQHARDYTRLFSDCPAVLLPQIAADRSHVFHLYVVRVPARANVTAILNDHRIGYGIHYPVPVHLQPAYAHLGYAAGAFPVAERCAQEVLSLPMYPELPTAHIECVVDELQSICSTAAGA